MFLKFKKKGKETSSDAPVPGSADAPSQGVQSTFHVSTPRIIELPDLKDLRKIDVTYPLIEPYAFVRIYWNYKSHELVYEIIEPVLSEQEQRILEKLERGIEELINISFIAIKNSDVVIQY